MTDRHDRDAVFIKGQAIPPYTPTPKEVADGRLMALTYTIGRKDWSRYLDRNEGADLSRLCVPAAVLEQVLRRVMSTTKDIFSEAELQRYLDWHQYKLGPGRRCIALGKPLDRKLRALSFVQRVALENVLVSIWQGDPMREISVALFRHWAGKFPLRYFP